MTTKIEFILCLDNGTWIKQIMDVPNDVRSNGEIEEWGMLEVDRRANEGVDPYNHVVYVGLYCINPLTS